MSSNHLEAILFDFDHTLAHLGNFMRWDDARDELLRLYSSKGVPETFLEAHSGAMGLYRDVATCGLLNDTELRAIQQKASRILEVLESEAISRTFMLPAAVEFVRHLPRLGLRAGIVTSNAVPVVSAILTRDGVAAAFEAVVGRDDVERLKPSPEGMLLCCERMKVPPHRCITVGDMVGDIAAGLAAEIVAFGVRGGMASDVQLRDAGAEAVLDDVNDLLKVLNCRSPFPSLKLDSPRLPPARGGPSSGAAV